VGKWVWLRLQHREATGITPLKQSKLPPRFFGPYQVIERIGEVAYRLQLPARARIHDVFHVALLKKFEGTPSSSMVPLPVMRHDRLLPVPLKIVKARLNHGSWTILVSWKDIPSSETTWEKVDIFKLSYPDILLKNELFFGEGEMLLMHS
jgi:hypothetical protein